MRLERIQSYLRQKNMPFTFWEDNDCGSVEFTHHGHSYHIWEYPAPQRGAASNVRTVGRTEDYVDDYEEAILAVMMAW